MSAIKLVFALGWTAFWFYWLIASFSMKRGRIAWSQELRIRALLVLPFIVLLRTGVMNHLGRHWSVSSATAGLVLFISGLIFAVWARLHIAHNWGTPMSRKDDTELVSSGPYGLVRHPIYSGILTAGVGTALALNWNWFVIVALAGVYFMYSATMEEHNLTEQFPVAYPRYQSVTKRFIPFIF